MGGENGGYRYREDGRRKGATKSKVYLEFLIKRTIVFDGTTTRGMAR